MGHSYISSFLILLKRPSIAFSWPSFLPCFYYCLLTTDPTSWTALQQFKPVCLIVHHHRRTCPTSNDGNRPLWDRIRANHLHQRLIILMGVDPMKPTRQAHPGRLAQPHPSPPTANPAQRPRRLHHQQRPQQAPRTHHLRPPPPILSQPLHHRPGDRRIYTSRIHTSKGNRIMTSRRMDYLTAALVCFAAAALILMAIYL